MAKKKKQSTADYYKSNPEAYKRKLAKDAERDKTPERKAYRAELARERRARGIMGKGGKDLSHTADGGFRLEKPSTNRARNGSGSNRRLNPAKGTRKQGAPRPRKK